MIVFIPESYLELRADLIVKERAVRAQMRATLDQSELRRLRDYRIDLWDAIHGWEQEVETKRTEVKKDFSDLSAYRPDPNNANRGTPRGHSIIEQSVRQRGAGRSGLAAADGTMIAGSQTLQKMAELGIPVKTVHTNGSEWVVVIRDDIEPGSEEAILLGLEDNRSSQLGLEWDPDVLAGIADAGIDLGSLFTAVEWADVTMPGMTEPEHSIVGHSEGYDFREIHAGKLAYRVEAAWRSSGMLAIDLFSGQGQLAEWYARRFDRVVRIDQEPSDGLDFVSDAERWLHSQDFATLAPDFDFIDFDDEGSPLRVVKILFDVLPLRDTPFVLCVTDGSGLNLKLHGVFSPSLYGLSGANRRATTADYDAFASLVSGAVERFAMGAGYTAHCWSSVRGSENNVVYQTFRIARPDAP